MNIHELALSLIEHARVTSLGVGAKVYALTPEVAGKVYAYCWKHFPEFEGYSLRVHLRDRMDAGSMAMRQIA